MNWYLTLGIPIGLGILFGGKKAFAFTTSPSEDTNAKPNSDFPKPPWFDSVLNANEKIPAYWADMGATKAKIRATQIANQIHKNGWNVKPSFEDFKAWYIECGKIHNVPYQLMRGLNKLETGWSPKPLLINASKSTACGLGQPLVSTCETMGFPYPCALYWKCGIWGTGKYLSQMGWSLGSNLPTLDEIKQAREIAELWGNDGAKLEDIPKWFRACMKYYSGAKEKAKYSAHYATKILGGDPDNNGSKGAIHGFEACTDSTMKDWDTFNASGLANFINGTATDLTGKA